MADGDGDTARMSPAPRTRGVSATMSLSPGAYLPRRHQTRALVHLTMGLSDLDNAECPLAWSCCATMPHTDY